MLTLPVIHPPLLGALGRAGHGSTVLLADGNYPHDTGAARTAERIFLNFRPGLLTVAQVLEGLVQVLPIESARVMRPDPPVPVPAFDGYRRLLGGMELEALERFAFYDACRQPELAVMVATADQQHHANLLLTVGAAPDPGAAP